MGAGHCAWGGYTDQLYVIYMERCSSHRAIAWCFGLGFLFNLAPCQPQWHNANSWGSPLSFYNIWQGAKNSWHSAKGTPPDPHRSWSDIYLTSMTQTGPEKAHFPTCLTLTLDLWPWNVKNQRAAIKTYLHTENEAPRSDGLGATGVH